MGTTTVTLTIDTSKFERSAAQAGRLLRVLQGLTFAMTPNEHAAHHFDAMCRKAVTRLRAGDPAGARRTLDVAAAYFAQEWDR